MINIRNRKNRNRKREKANLGFMFLREKNEFRSRRDESAPPPRTPQSPPSWSLPTSVDLADHSRKHSYLTPLSSNFSPMRSGKHEAGSFPSSSSSVRSSRSAASDSTMSPEKRSSSSRRLFVMPIFH